MPTNTLVIEKGAELEVKVFDGDGVEHDITSAFRSMAGSTSPAGVTNKVVCQSENTNIELDFTATSKDLKFGIPESVVKQLVPLAE